MSLPRHHNRRLGHYTHLLRYFHYLLRTHRLDVEPPARCRTRLVAALAAERADAWPN